MMLSVERVQENRHQVQLNYDEQNAMSKVKLKFSQIDRGRKEALILQIKLIFGQDNHLMDCLIFP